MTLPHSVAALAVSAAVTVIFSPSAPAHAVQLPPPFTTQAPFGNWADPREQGACEEASIVMAWHWVTGTSFTRVQALKEILALSRYSGRHLGEWRDTSAADTARLMRDYYEYRGVTVKYDIQVNDVINELGRGNLVIVPTDGTKLNNPYYRRPGPPEHMLLVYDYDARNQTFITNDPGTRHGAGLRYPSAVLGRALRDYPTGSHEPNPHPRTAMIVVRPR